MMPPTIARSYVNLSLQEIIFPKNDRFYLTPIEELHIIRIGSRLKRLVLQHSGEQQMMHVIVMVIAGQTAELLAKKAYLARGRVNNTAGPTHLAN